MRRPTGSDPIGAIVILFEARREQIRERMSRDITGAWERRTALERQVQAERERRIIAEAQVQAEREGRFAAEARAQAAESAGGGSRSAGLGAASSSWDCDAGLLPVLVPCFHRATYTSRSLLAFTDEEVSWQESQSWH
ncbi:hypothetical protein B0H14DRAFT_3446948 [Mycena olivaceomarginata]|nr:hypothetical protein B0H14DRAFT_3446948 [Mycena olivaceomarginata]